MKYKYTFTQPSTRIILTYKEVKCFLLFLFIGISFNAHAQNSTIKINVTSDNYLVYNFVDLNLILKKGKDENDNWKKLNKRPVRSMIYLLKQPDPISFQTNIGYIEHNRMTSNKWHFNRDSVMQFCKGVLKLKVSYTAFDVTIFDSIQIVLPRISKIEPSFFSRSSDYFNNIFEKWVTIHFEDGRTKSSPSYFYHEESNYSQPSILNGVVVKGDVYYHEGRYKMKYDNPENKKHITFVNRKTNELINTVQVPKSIYIFKEIITFKYQPSELDNITHSKDGNAYRIDTTTKLFFQINNSGYRINSTPFKLSDIDLDLLNGENGYNGRIGRNGKSIIVNIDRANKIDSIAKITISVDDTSYVYFVDIIRGGKIIIYNPGGSGAKGGYGGECGYIENIDSVLIWGKAGKGGAGGNGGDGGDVIINVDKIYREYMSNIVINNEGGSEGRGGNDAYQISHDIAPRAGYFNEKRPYIMMSKSGGIDYSKSEIEYVQPRKDKTKIPPPKSKAPDGNRGKTGQVIYNFY